MVDDGNNHDARECGDKAASHIDPDEYFCSCHQEIGNRTVKFVYLLNTEIHFNYLNST